MIEVAMFSLIPVSKSGDGYVTNELWARDLNQQAANQVVKLICPVVNEASSNMGRLKDAIQVADLNACSEPELLSFVGASKLAQFPTGGTWSAARKLRRMLPRIKLRGVIVVVGLSSDRVRTYLLNARSERNPYRFLKLIWVAISVYLNQRHFLRSANAFIVVGPALANRVRSYTVPLQVQVPSWLYTEDYLSEQALQGRLEWIKEKKPLRLSVAGRLEYMKGFHVAIEALAHLVKKGRENFSLLVFGDGEEKSSLESLASELSVRDLVDFKGYFAYPQPFLEELSRTEILLMTNLNREQPRIFFDAISQGVLVLCPKASPYIEMNLPEVCYYPRGDGQALSKRVFELLENRSVFCQSLVKQFSYGKSHTLDRMHAQRDRFYRQLIQESKAQG